MGAASAAEDNATSDVALETADFDVSSQSVDEIDAGGDTDLSQSASSDAVDDSAAVSSDVKNSKDEKLGNANDEVISAPVDEIIYDFYVSDSGGGSGLYYDDPASIYDVVQMIGDDGANILFLDGGYELDDSIMIHSNVRLIGESRDGVCITFGESGGILIFDMEDWNDYDLEYVMISNMTFYDITSPVFRTGYSVEDLTISNCVFDLTQVYYNNVIAAGFYPWDEPADDSYGTFNFIKNIVYTPDSGYQVFFLGPGYYGNINDNLFFSDGELDLNMLFGDLSYQGSYDLNYNYWNSNDFYGDIEYWIEFHVESDASEIYTDETATITAYAILCDGSDAAEHLPDKVTVDLTAGGNLNPNSGDLEDGIMQSTYSSSVARNDNVNLILYNHEIESVPIKVKENQVSTDFTVNDISDVAIGNGVTVSGTITPSNQAASLAIKVNNNLINTITATGSYSQAISADNLRAGLNTVEVTSNGVTKSKTFNVIKIGIDVTSEIDLGDDNSVTVTVPDGTGTVTIKVNDNVIATPALSSGTVTQTISASSIVEGENTVEVIYNGFTNSTTFNAISGNVDISSDIGVTDTWVNYATTVYATCPVESGSVTIKVNGRNVATAAVNNGEVSQEIAAQYLTQGVNTVEVIGNGFSGQTTFRVYDYDGIVTADTFFNYFNSSNSNRLCDHVPEGATLDFRGYFNSTSSVSYIMEINKPINMISTTKDAYVNLNTIAQGMTGENPGDRFTVSYGGSGSNISDIYFYNSQLWFFNAHNLTITNVTSYVSGQTIGSGVGVVAFRGGSSHIKVKDCFFYTQDNGGHSNFVLTNASYLSVDNCTIQGEGNVGNLIYLNLFNIETLPEGTFMPQVLQMIKKGEITINDHNNFTNCRIIGPSTPLAICYIFTEQGNGYTVFENNTIYYNGSNINPGPYATVKNNVVIGSCDMSINGYGFNNTLQGALTVTAGSEAVGNTAGSLSVSGKDAKVINNTINGAVSLSNKATGTNFTGNTVTGTVTVQSGSSTIVGNNIISTGSYAVDLKTTSNNVVTDNYLVSSDKKGDEAVNVGSGSGNVVQNNGPIDVGLALAVEKTNFWLPNTNTVTVTASGEGTVEIKVNGRTVATPEIDNGEAVYTLATSDMKAGENTVTAIYQGAEVSETFYVYGLVTNETWDMYFDRDNSGRFKDFVPEGAILDFQGKFLSSADASFVMEINKPVNIISTTKDVLIDLNTTAGSLMGENPGDRFTVSNGGSGSNISDLNFHNSQIWVYNAHHVVLDHISNVIDGQRVGSGVGATSIRANSTYVTVKNSYFYTKDNGGSSSLVMAWADYCTFQNNTVEVEGNVGNLIYLTTYNVDVPSGVIVNHHNNITDNTVRRLDGQSAAICWGIVIGGPYNLIKNNTVYYAGGTGITGQYGGGSGNGVGNVYEGNKLYNAAMSALSDAVVRDNYIEGSSLTVAAGGEVYNNTIVGSGSLTATSSTLYNNNVNKVVLDGADTVASGTFTDLDIKSNVNLSDIEVTGTLRFMGSNSIVSDSTVNDVIFGESKSNKAVNSKLTDSTIEGSVTFTQRASEGNALIGDNITQTVILQGVNDIVYQNNIITTSNYAVDATSSRASGNNITDNYLISNGKKGNDAVTYASGKDHIVENNGPDLAVGEVADVTMGDDTVIPITVLPTFRNTEVTIKVNDNIINETQAGGSFEQTVKPTDIVIGENTVEVSAYGITKTTTFTVSKADVTIDISAADVTYGEDVIVEITGSVDGDYTVTVNGVTKDVDLVAGESASVNFGALDADTYAITANYAETANY
ncbi:beta strand repeat-containing protein, partial [Methanobrevibacter sp.]|uniref:beta strand repeat-containing protein n=1 Tax=Methanobrevibacter sp. TaxID=66852 RepID=UPI003865996A